MKKLLLIAALAALTLPTLGRASDAFGVISGTTGACGSVIPYGFTANTPPYLTYTAGAAGGTVSSKIFLNGPMVITRIILSVTATAAGGSTITMYDTTNGCTGTATRMLVPPTFIPVSTNGLVAELNFVTQKSARTDEDGLYVKNIPIFVNAGNLINGIVFFRPFTAPTQSGAAK